jgi:hypothetical protein
MSLKKNLLVLKDYLNDCDLDNNQFDADQKQLAKSIGSLSSGMKKEHLK